MTRAVRWQLVLVMAGIAAASFAMIPVNRKRAVAVGHESAAGIRSLSVASGAVAYLHAEYPVTTPAGWFAHVRRPLLPQEAEFTQTHWWPRLRSRPASAVVILPLWMVGLPAAAGAACAARGLRRSAWTCRCGYDLRGLPEASACPECAAKTKQQA